jgi:hypothetical protein
MVVDVKNLVAAINPDVFCKPEKRSTVKSLVKMEGYLKAAEEAELIESDFMNFENVDLANPFSLQGIRNPVEQHFFNYDISGSPNQILEELYFWILDYVNGAYGKSEKLVDNFVASPGSSLFTENLQKRSAAEQNASRMFGLVNDVVKSITSLIYSLKEYKTLLALYDKLHSKDRAEREAAMMSLKQRWLDRVDIQKGGTSLKQLAITGAQQPNFVFAIDAFMSAQEVGKMPDLNERLKNIIRQRLQEFLVWLEESEDAVRKRYMVEKNYLKAQLSTLKLYASWAKPYLKSAQKLRENAQETSALVNAFNTALFELTLLGIGKYDPAGAVASGDLPRAFERKILRKYSPIVLIDMKFRSTPENVGQHARFRGRVEISFTSFALNEDEISVLKQEIEKDDIGDVLGSIEGATSDTLEQLKEEVEDILEEKKGDVNKDGEDTNPFSALFSIFKSDKKVENGDLSRGVPKDSEYEKVIRSLAIISSRRNCRRLYGTLKKANGMPAFRGE